MSSHLILHIGSHKTGTTALQNFLAANEEPLRTKGFLYPSMPRRWGAAVNRNGHFLHQAALQEIGSTQLKYPEKIEDCLEHFKKVVSDSAGPVILSDERIWYAGNKNGYWPAIVSIAKSCGVTDITVVAYLRRQDQFIESLWAEYVKDSVRTTSTLSDYLSRDKTMTVCDYAKGLRRIERRVGKGNVLVRVYDRAQLKDGDIISDFAELIGLEIDDSLTAPEPEHNPSLSPSATLIKLAANAAPTYKEGDDFLFEPANLITSQDEQRKASFLTDEERKEFLSRFREGNAWVARNLLGREDGVLFDDASDGASPVFEADALKIAQQTCTMLVEALAVLRNESEERCALLENELALLRKEDEALQKQNEDLAARVNALEKQLARVNKRVDRSITSRMRTIVKGKK